MRRALNIFGIIALTAVITYLWASKNLAEQRAARLGHALENAEARVTSLEGDLESTAQQLDELKIKQTTQLRTFSSVHQQHAVISSLQTARMEADGAIAPVSSNSGAGGRLASNPAEGSFGPWYSYAVFGAAGFTNLVRIEGTSSIHNWQVESHLISGSAQFNQRLVPSSETRVSLQALEAKVNVSILVRSLKSVDAAGNPYSDRMDEIIYDKLRAGAYNRITYSLLSLTPTEQAADTSTGFVYDAIGQLSVAGQTNAISMPVSLKPGPDGKVQFAGSVQIKMSDFKISPPAPSFDGTLIKSGDDVRVSFVWWIKPLGGIAASK
jgi:hypothetical protein